MPRFNDCMVPERVQPFWVALQRGETRAAENLASESHVASSHGISSRLSRQPGA